MEKYIATKTIENYALEGRKRAQKTTFWLLKAVFRAVKIGASFTK